MSKMVSFIALALTAAPVAAAPATTPAASRSTVERYYAAINHGAFRTAYGMWDGDGRSSGKSYAGFRRGFRATVRTRVTTFPAINGDAGMSQRWVDVPVDMFATLKSGRHQHFRGHFTLHRVVAGVGAAPSDESWHISRARLVAVR